MDIGHLENIWLKAIINNHIYIEHCRVEFFTDLSLKELFKLIKSFYVKYQEVPTAEQVKQVIRILKVEDKLTNDQVDTIFDIDLSKYDEDWLSSNVESWIEWKNLEISAVEAVTYVKTTPVTPDNVKDVISKFKTIINERNSIDFSFNMGSSFFDPKAHVQAPNSTFPSGYNFMDTVLGGGFSIKTLNVLIGQPNIGKSIWLANIAAQAFRASYNVAVVSFEMSETKYMRRLGSNLLGVKMSEYDEFANTPGKLKKALDTISIKNLKIPGELYLKEFPTSNATVPDIERWCKKMEEIRGIKFKIIVIDYINIIKNYRNPNSENTYMKIKQLAEDLRGMAVANEWCVVTATQVKQGEFDATDLTMSSAAESSGLAATVDTMFGIIQDPLMHANSEYKLKTLKNRDEGYKNSYKLFKIDYNYMRITEDTSSGIISEN